ncbi:hypothetical protein CPB83DRAFT_879715 [Crepidotus variabilis]|uniref:Uncharacterized protein n=1 Tax=Crepidotus variabilis TaxID=179855 RepID=A0A9P6JVC9_9AGAR|nr:hypothetical protein CPB83DRAFT_879715 [Crepidotus variabilis]
MAGSFEILRITACSDHPVRNSAEELIYGNHALWEVNDPRVDDKSPEASLSPNVFSYDFTSALSANSTLYATVKVVDDKLYGADYILQGSQDGTVVFTSEAFTISSSEEITAATHVITPHDSSSPISFRGDFTWTLIPKEQKEVGQVEHPSQQKTRLELYWIAKEIDESFLAGLSGIYVNFLRHAIPSYAFGGAPKAQPPFNATQQAFYNYSKVYDTAGGYPSFVVSSSGGTFNYRYYIMPAYQGGPLGALQTKVNCYDQTAMVQVSSTIGAVRPFWLYQEPNGWINTTRLVGVPLDCNNPFFRSNNTSAFMPVNDLNRTQFGNHAFNGHPPNNSAIYDACGGPHLGNESAAAYVQAAIDRTTNLYSIKQTRPGTVSDIQIKNGVTSVLSRFASPANAKIKKGVEDFLQKCSVKNAKQSSQVHWDDVSQWVKAILGDGCEVAFQDTTVGDGVVESLWHLKGASKACSDVMVRVWALTLVGEDGDLDYDKSCLAAFDQLAFKLQDLQLDVGPNAEKLDTLWAPTPFDDYAQYALQYAAQVTEGRFLIVSGNFMIDISGGPSSAALEPLVRKLLVHTTVDTPSSRHIPKLTKHSYEIPDINRGASDEVMGLFTTFDLKCNVDDLVAAARADVEGHGLLLSKYTVSGDKDAKTSTVTFTFVTRAVGTHNVDFRFEEALTMNTSTKRIQITVIDA